MLHFEGVRDVSMSPAEAWSKLRDARFLVSCVPDASILPDPQRDRAACSVRPDLAFVGGSLQVTIEIQGGTEPTDLKFRVNSKGIGSTSEVETVLTITAAGSGAHIQWAADVKSLGGLLKAVPSGLIRGAAQKTIDSVWTEIEKKLVNP
jgi:carbon monoxide dehydrogenase subunit G